MKLKKMLAMGLAVTMVLGTTGCGIKVKFNPVNEATVEEFMAEIVDAVEQSEIENNTEDKTEATGIEGYESQIRDLGDLLAEAETGKVSDDSMESSDQNTVVITSEGSSENAAEGDWVSTLETALADAFQTPTSSPLGSVINGDVYECAQVGLKFTTPEGYRVATNEMAMVNSMMAYMSEAEGVEAEFMGVSVPESVIDTGYLMLADFLAMEESGTNGSVMICTLETGDTDFFMNIVNENGGEKVSKWGREWICVPEAEDMNGETVEGSTYYLEMEGMLYIINVMAGEGGDDSLDKLLNAFEQM